MGAPQVNQLNLETALRACARQAPRSDQSFIFLKTFSGIFRTIIIRSAQTGLT